MQRTALITGSSSGLAVAFARRLAAHDYQLVLNYRDRREDCETLATALRQQFGNHIVTMQADMTRAQEIHAMMDDIESTFGQLDTLIHSAGPFIFQRKRLTDYHDEEWNEMLDGNLTSSFHLFRRAIPLMRPRAFGRIITLGFAGVETLPGWNYRAAYAAAKTGLASLTRSVAAEERENGITANMVCPGDIRGKMKEAKWDQDERWSPLRPPIGEDIAHLIDFLISRESQYLTGNILSLTGDVDVIGHFDSGKAEVFDDRVIAVGATVTVVPWNMEAVVTERQDHSNRRSIYTVQATDQVAQFTIDQLIEVSAHGF